MAVSYGELEGWWEGWRAECEGVSGGGGEQVPKPSIGLYTLFFPLISD